MQKHYGIAIYSADVIKSVDVKEFSLCTNQSNVHWFKTEEAAISFANYFLYNYPFTNDVLPGIVFLYITDKLYYLYKTQNIPGCIGIGGSKASINASLVYCPPPECLYTYPNHRLFMYQPDVHDIPQLIESYETQIELPDNYKPTFASSDTSYMHYGNKVFYAEHFHSVGTSGYTLKPTHGFWGSVENSENGWKQWCQKEGFCGDKLDLCLRFNLMPNAKVMKVQTLDDIAYLIKNYPAPFTSKISIYESYVRMGLPYKAIDYGKMSKDFDGIEYSYTKLGNILGQWDCDSVIIFNPDVIDFNYKSTLLK